MALAAAPDSTPGYQPQPWSWLCGATCPHAFASSLPECLPLLAHCLSAWCAWCVAGVNVARMLIDRGDLVLIADNQGVRDIYSADGNSIDKSTPLVVLVNKGTASASEVGSWEPAAMAWFVAAHAEYCVGHVSQAVSASAGHSKHLPSVLTAGLSSIACWVAPLDCAVPPLTCTIFLSAHVTYYC